MMNWLENDIASTTQKWVIVFFHHPPYSGGYHKSDSDAQLIEMRTRFNPIIENYGVDLVLCGHSHCYERTFLIDGHYGLSTNFTAAMKKGGGDGRIDGGGAYTKTDGSHNGAVYLVTGSGSKYNGGPVTKLPCMYTAFDQIGSVMLDIDATSIHAKFISGSNGAIDDSFTIIKSDAPLFSDGFQDGDSGGWTSTGGMWTVANPSAGVYEYHKTDTGMGLSSAGTNWSNCIVESRVNLANENGGVCLLGRVQSSNLFYQLELKKVSGIKKWLLWLNNNGAWSEIASGNYTWSANTWYTLRLSLQGSQLLGTISTDGGQSFQELGGGTNGVISSGKMGVRAWGSTAKFDDVKVIAP
jgi:3',5'-cyclic AMP phosphodiesterase CpdA